MFEPPPSPRESDRRDPIGFDELLALVIAFLTVGAVLWWTLGRRAETWLGRLAPVTREQPAVPSPVNPIAPPGETRIQNAPGTVVQPSVSTVPAPVAPAPGRNLPRTVTVVPVVVPPATQPSPEAQPAPTVTVSPSPGAPIIEVPSPAAGVNFTDVPNTYWAYPFISELGKRGIITGFADGTYQPDQAVNRAQYAALVSTILPGEQQAATAFGDVPGTFWAKPSIDQSVSSGFVKGYPGGLYEPTKPISRMEVLLSLVNGFGLGKSSNPEPALAALQDQAEIPAWARPAIGTAAESGMIVSYPDPKLLNPNQPATRADVAAMLYQALNATGRVEPVQSNYIVRP